MKKISTFFKKDPNNLDRVINAVDPNNEWVFTHGVPTRKFDGTSCAIINGVLYKRYDCKIDKKTGLYKRLIPVGAIPCQEADKISGHHPHWVECIRSDKSNKYHFEGLDNLKILGEVIDGTYELCGTKIQGNPEKLNGHYLIRHGCEKLQIREFDFNTIKKYLEITDIEGIVFHHKEDGSMCKIRKTDFGIKR